MPKKPVRKQRAKKRPDFGTHTVYHEGVALSCSYCAPGLTLHDVMKIFHKAEKGLRPGDEYSANPSVWPNVRGLIAVVDALVDAFTKKSSS